MKIKFKKPKYCDYCPCLNNSEDGTYCNLKHFEGELYHQPTRKTGIVWNEINPEAGAVKHWKEADPSMLKYKDGKVFLKNIITNHIRPQSCIKKHGL